VWGLNRLYMPKFEAIPVWGLDRIGRGGDHSPYVVLGDPGLRFTERIENYNRQHLPTDDFEHVNFGYVANIARANAVVVASLANAPRVPANARAARQGRAGADPAGRAPPPSSSGGQAWTLSWQPSEGAVSYELVIRRTTAPTWEQVVPLGNVTSCSLKRQLDDEWAGVRAVGASGARSIVASMPAPNAPPSAGPAAATTNAQGSQPPAVAGRGAGPSTPPPLCGGA